MVTVPNHEPWVMVVLILLVVEVFCFILIIALNVKLIVWVKRSYPSEFEWFIGNNHIQYGLSFILFNRLPAHDHILDDADVKRLRRKVIASLVAFVAVFVALFTILYLKRMGASG